jgi:hypothetical protein
MIHPRCLNCGKPVDTPYCAHCGQSIKTHRFSLKRVVIKDTIEKLLDWERGVGRTLWGLFRRPGTMLRHYLYGQRKKYMQYLRFLFIVLILEYILDFFSGVRFTDITGEGEAFEVFGNFITGYAKLYLLAVIPFNAFFGYWIFRRASFNLAEHLVVGTYKYSVETIVSLLFIITTYFTTDTALLRVLFPINLGLQFIYSVYLYYDLFRPYYRQKWGVGLRALTCTVLAALVSHTLILLGLALVSGIRQAMEAS